MKLQLFFLWMLCVLVLGEDEEKSFCDSDTDELLNEQEGEITFCQTLQLKDSASLYEKSEYSILTALGTSYLNRTYPTRIGTQQSFAVYDELPSTVPTGASTFFMVIFTMIFTWYVSHLLHWSLQGLAEKVNLFPETDRFPNLNLYMLQQSKRESEMNRDVRNTWAWLAQLYLLRPGDANVKLEELVRPAGWQEFGVPREVWSILRTNLEGNVKEKAKKGQGRGRKESLKKTKSDSKLSKESKKSK